MAKAFVQDEVRKVNYEEIKHETTEEIKEEDRSPMFLSSKNLNFPQANHRRNRSAMPAMISIIIEPLPDNEEES